MHQPIAINEGLLQNQLDWVSPEVVRLNVDETKAGGPGVVDGGYFS